MDGQVTPTTISSREPVKNYATSKAEYTNTQLDLPGVRSLLSTSRHAAVWLRGLVCQKHKLSLKSSFSFSSSSIII
jgi:hypothetical protein